MYLTVFDAGWRHEIPSPRLGALGDDNTDATPTWDPSVVIPVPDNPPVDSGAPGTPGDVFGGAPVELPGGGVWQPTSAPDFPAPSSDTSGGWSLPPSVITGIESGISGALAKFLPSIFGGGHTAPAAGAHPAGYVYNPSTGQWGPPSGGPSLMTLGLLGLAGFVGWKVLHRKSG